MNHEPRKRYVVDALDGYEPDIGRWLWALEDTRRATRRAVEDVESDVLDWVPENGRNSIGALLYHIAAIEVDWLCMEVLEQPELPSDVKVLFPFDVTEGDGRLARAQGISLEDHVSRLDTTRALLLESFRGMSLEEFHRSRSFAHYDVTPEWVLYHLIQHESEHQGQIVQLRTIAGRDRVRAGS